MAEHDAERTGSEEEREPLPAGGTAVPDEEGGAPAPENLPAPAGAEGERPVDEDAVWKAIVEGYGEEPPDPPGARPFRSVEDLALPEEDSVAPDPDKGLGKSRPKPPEKPLGSSVVFAPGVGGPRDYEPAEPAEGDVDDDDDSGEGHFVPPEPPPLPEADVTAKFAWLA
ncbi:hypothetical protein, partial [Streptomyces poriferorum]